MSEKILIVDDEPTILMALEFMMKKGGFSVFIARDGSEALEIINAEAPKMIILDIMMPEVDGYEVCRYVKDHATFHTTKVIFLSAKSREEDIADGYAVGADLYMTKPFSNRNLMEEVKRLINE